jgi:hypothetical protein
MTTQYTTILKLALPVQGELSGTWGDVVNDNITQMVEQAVAGKAVINTWTGNSHTLTTADGTTSESRCAILELTDTGTALTGAGTVVCPTNTKLYIVDNNTAQIITVKTSGGTGVAVPVGKTMLVYCDGTNVVEGVTHANSLSLGTSTNTVNAISIATDLGDTGSSNSNLPTQLAVKTYVDGQIAATNELSEVLAAGNVTGANDIDVENAQKVQFRDAAIYVNSSADGQLDIVADGEVQIDTALVDINGNLDVSGTTNISGSVSFTKNAIAGVAISTIARASNTVTVTNSAVHGLTSGDLVNVNGVADTSFNGYFTVSVSSTTVFTYNQTGADGSSTGGTSTEVVYNLNASGTALNWMNGPLNIAANSGIDGLEITQSGSGNGLHVTGTTDLVGNVDVTGTVTATGTSVFASLDISGDIDVDGTTNLDVVDIDGAVDMASTLAVGGKVRVAAAADGTSALMTFDSASNFSSLQMGNNSGSGSAGGVLLYGSSGNEFALYQYTGAVGSETYGAPTFSLNSIGGATFNPSASGFAVFNEGGVDADFRVESDGNANMLFVDASANRVTIGGNDGTGSLTVKNTDSGGSDVYIHAQNPTANRIAGFKVLDEDGDAQVTLQYDNGSDTPSLVLQKESAGNMSFSFDGSSSAIASNSTSATLDFKTSSTTRMSISVGGGITTTPLDDKHAVFNEGSASSDFRVESNDNANMLFVDGGGNHVNIGTGTDLYGLLNVNGDLSLSGAGTSNRYVALLAETNTYAGTLMLQAGGGSAAYGAAVVMHGHSHATNPGMLYLAGSSGAGGKSVVIGRNGISVTAASEMLTAYSNGTELVINEYGNNQDFRVESDGNANMLFVDGGANKVYVGAASAGVNGVLQVTGSIGLTGNTEIRQSTNSDGSTLRFLGTQLVIANSNSNGYSYSGGGLVASVSPSAGAITLDAGANNTSGHRLKVINGADGVQGSLQYLSSTTARLNIDSATGAFTTTSAAGGHAVFNEAGADADFRVESDNTSAALFVDGTNGKVVLGGTTANADFYITKITAGEVVRADNSQANWNGVMYYSVIFGTGNNNGSISADRHFQGYAGGAARFIVCGNGDVKNNNNSYGAISDLKLKENIVDSGSQWDDIKALRIRKYSMKDEYSDVPTQIGVIAQELEAAGMGGLVTEGADLDVDNNDLGTTTKQVTYSVLYMKAVKALQEAMERIESLEARIAALES